VNVLVIYGVLIVAPAAAFWVLVKALGWWTNSSGLRRKAATPPGAAPSLQRLVDDLRRLEREYLRIERSDLPARAARLRALNLAYDDTLRACCHELGLPEPCERPLSGVVRLQTEAELAQHGLVW
jgi:hypothetical protein